VTHPPFDGLVYTDGKMLPPPFPLTRRYESGIHRAFKMGVLSVNGLITAVTFPNGSSTGILVPD